MSTNLPEQQPSEEIDLGGLFKVIGNSFNRLFKFIGSILNKLFLAFVWFVFFTKKNIVKLLIAGVIGVGLGFIKEKTEVPVYKSTMVIKQNYNTGEHLFNTIEYYNSLMQQKDSMELSKILMIPPEQASNIVALEMESNLAENSKLLMFDEYTNKLDSATASGVRYKDYLNNEKDYSYSIQKLTLKSLSRSNFSQALVTILENIEEREYFKTLRDKQINELHGSDSVIKEALKESKALNELYKEVLKKPLEELPTGATTNIAIGGTKDNNVTKEYELFGNDLELRRELVSNKTRRKELEDIIEIISSQDGNGTLENKAKLFGKKTTWEVLFAVILVFATFVILFLLHVLKFLERYKDKI